VYPKLAPDALRLAIDMRLEENFVARKKPGAPSTLLAGSNLAAF